jgi:radical SAM superfamily enzyme YgiQ (UPF0313 family)
VRRLGTRIALSVFGFFERSSNDASLARFESLPHAAPVAFVEGVQQVDIRLYDCLDLESEALLKILLINPGQLEDAGEDQFAGRIDSVFFRVKPFSRTYFGIPLAIPTLAGLTPQNHEVIIIDEMVEPIDFDAPCDLVGLSAMTCKAERAYQIAREFRNRGVKTVMGGIHATMCPDEAACHVDCVAVGEADTLWPVILSDAEKGDLKQRYTAEEFPDVTLLPPPRHDLTPHTRYFSFFLQTTRGCPRSCKFCTVTAVNGKVLRKKSPDQVILEVEAAIGLPNKLRPTIVDRERGNQKRKVASGTIFFVDDNFAIDREHALSVCRALRAFQDEKNVHINWFTQCDVNTGFDDELLFAMKDAGCMNIFMGFESLSRDTLNAMKKNINSPDRYLECIRNIEKHGIEVTVSVIVGTDFETRHSGEEMAAFAIKNQIFYLFPNIMTPYPGTRLMEEMESEGRVLLREPELYNIRNVVFQPKQMSPMELQTLYTTLCAKVLSLDNLLKTASLKVKRQNRYYLTHGWRILIWISFSLVFSALFLTRKITFRDLLKLFFFAPRLILKDGSLNALGFMVNAVGFGTFSRSEVKRLPTSGGARLLKT